MRIGPIPKNVRAGVWLGVVCLISGCTTTTEVNEGDTTVFRWAMWVPVLAIFGGIFSVILGLLLRRRLRRISATLTILGPILCIFFAPAWFHDRVTVNRESFTVRTGFWWSPSVYSVQFEDLSRIELIAKERFTRRTHETNYYLVCFQKDGRRETVPDNDLMRRGAADRILQTAQDLGIPVEDTTTYAAIAYSPSTGEYGSASDCTKLAEAERIALSHCKEKDARVVVWSHDAWCALAVGEDKAHGYGWGHTKAEAERGALTHCRQRTKTRCRIAVALFSGTAKSE